MTAKALSTKDAPQAIGPYSQAVERDGWIYVSGQIPLDPASGKLVEGTIAVQAHRCLTSLRAILESAGMSLANVVKVQVYLTNMDDFAAVNEVYAKFFSEPYPARAAVGVSSLPKGVSIEIDCVAKR